MTRILLPLMAMALLLACRQYRDTRLNAGSLSDLVENFDTPPAGYSTAPFMVWNGKVTHEKINRQLEEFASVGIKQAFIHPRWGMVTPYLDSNWFDLVAYTVAKGKTMGMKIWLYDENAFPSGFAGGQVQLAMPASYQHPVGLSMFESTGLDTMLARKSLIVLMEKGGVFKEVNKDATIPVDRKSHYFYFTGVMPEPASNYAGFPYVDLIMPGVTDTFIALTMEGYERTIGKEFGRSVPGIFTDEPNIRSRGGRVIRYTPDLFEQFEKVMGYRLQDKLPELFLETGTWKATRHDYYQLLLNLFVDRWAKPWNAYTTARGVTWTGHYWEHGWPDPSHNPDNMAFYQYHQMPGIDMLFNNRELQPDQFGNIRAVKELVSVANQMGYRRTLSETYGASGYDLTFDAMKRNGDWQYALGVNFMNQHLSYMDIVGDRKHDFPQTFSAHNPWWKHYKAQSDYFARLSLALSFGEQLNHTLVLEPTTTAWMYYTPGRPNDTLKAIKTSFDELLYGLEDNAIRYDLATENMLPAFGKVAKGGLSINKRTYSLIILPPYTETLDTVTFTLLDKYIREGNKLLAFSVPSYIDGRPTDACKIWFDEFSGNVKLIEKPDAKFWSTLADADFNIFKDSLARGELYHMRRELDGGQLIFLANFSPSTNSHGEIKLKGKHLYKLDAESGQIFHYPAIATNGLLNAEFRLSPSGSLLLLASTKRIRGAYNYNIPSGFNDTLRLTAPVEAKRKGMNVLVLDYCQLTSQGKTKGTMHTFDATATLFKDNGYSANPWSVGVQLGEKWLASDTFSDGTGFDAVYSFTVSASFDNTRPLRLAVEQPAVFNVSVNGKPVKPSGEWWLDPEIGLYDITRIAKPGKNTIRLYRSSMSVFAELEPVYVLGDFVLRPANPGFVIDNETEGISMGSWAPQGYPFYFNSISYIGHFKGTGEENSFTVHLPDWKGVVAEVIVNGRSAGTVSSSPGWVALADGIRAGNNTVEIVVYGSLQNVLGPFHQKPVPGMVTPWSWRFAPHLPPAGNQYNVNDYGLFKDFFIVESPKPSDL